MNLTISQPALAGLLADVGPSIQSKASLPILTHVLLKAVGDSLQATGNNLELSLTAKAQCSSQSVDAIAVEFAKLSRIVASLPRDTDVQLVTANHRLTLKAGRSRFQLNTRNAEDYPLPTPSDESSQSITLDGQALADLLRAVAFAMAADDVRYYLNGVCLEIVAGGLLVTGTDGHRLAHARLDVAHELEPAVYILPHKTVQALLRWCEGGISLTLHRTQLRIEAGSRGLVSKLVDGKYPEYQRVIPKPELHPGAVAVDRAALLDAINRAAIMTSDTFKGIILSFDGDLMTIDASNNQGGEAQDALEIEGNSVEGRLGLRYEYLIDALKATNAARVILHYGDGNTPLRVAPDVDDPPIWIIMPMLL